MGIAAIIKYGMVIMGLIVVLASFWFHSIKKMTPDLAVAWCLLGVVMITVGLVPALSAWIDRISGWTGLALFGVGAVCLWGGFQICLLISKLLTQNQELAMQISLLMEENQRILRDLQEQREMSGLEGSLRNTQEGLELDDEEDIACN